MRRNSHINYKKQSCLQSTFWRTQGHFTNKQKQNRKGLALTVCKEKPERKRYIFHIHWVKYFHFRLQPPLLTLTLLSLAVNYSGLSTWTSYAFFSSLLVCLRMLNDATSFCLIYYFKIDYFIILKIINEAKLYTLDLNWSPVWTEIKKELKWNEDLYAPEMHLPLWLRFDWETRTTDSTGNVQTVIESELPGRQLQQPNWSDWWEIRCLMFPCETDNEPVNCCSRQICRFCSPQKISGEKNLRGKMCNFLQHSIL